MGERTKEQGEKGLGSEEQGTAGEVGCPVQRCGCCPDSLNHSVPLLAPSLSLLNTGCVCLKTRTSSTKTSAEHRLLSPEAEQVKPGSLGADQG